METMNRITENAILLVDSHHGKYMGSVLVENYLNDPTFKWDGVSEEDIEIMKDPDHEYYYEALDFAMYHISMQLNGITYGLYWNEDLWAIPDGDYTDEEWEEWFI